MEKTIDDIPELTEKLALLRRRDKKRIIFGAERHGYMVQYYPA